MLKTPFLAVVCAAFGALCLSSEVSAQASKVELEKPQFDDLASPTFTGGKLKSFDAKDWLEVEASVKVEMKPVPRSKTCEALTVRWYVAVENPDKPGTFFLLTKDVEHVNVPLDEKVFSSVYLSPSSVKRLTGKDRANKGAVKFVALEVLVNGELKGAEFIGPKEWWKKTSNKISRTDSVPLLNKMETPFAHMWWDRYAEIAPPRR